MVMKKKDYSAQGKRNRAAGGRFELKVREDLESMGWTLSKWMNTLEKGKEGFYKLVPSKRKYNPYSKAFVIGTGFPDFVCFKKKGDDFEVIGVEVKKNGYLDQVEKGMCLWLIENKIFSRLLMAKAKKEGRAIKIEYVDVEKKLKK
jgi:hypothetical protein